MSFRLAVSCFLGLFGAVFWGAVGAPVQAIGHQIAGETVASASGGDVDGDGVPDGVEVGLCGLPGCASSVADADGDGVSDWVEFMACGSASCVEGRADVDGDGVPDFAEVLVCGNVLCASGFEDSQGDGISDWTSFVVCGSAGCATGFEDFDSDGFPDVRELQGCVRWSLASTGGIALTGLLLLGLTLVALGAGLLIRRRGTGGRSGSARSKSARRGVLIGIRGRAPIGRGGWALRGISGVVLLGFFGGAGAVPPAEAVSVGGAFDVLAEVRSAAAKVSGSDDFAEPKPPLGVVVGSGAVAPGSGGQISGGDFGLVFSGHDVAETLDVQVKSLAKEEGMLAATEVGGTAVSDVIEVDALTASGSVVTLFPPRVVTTTSHASVVDASKVSDSTVNTDVVSREGLSVANISPERVVDVVPGVQLSVKVDPSRVAGLDAGSLRIMTRENAGEPWHQIPSFYDVGASVMRGEVNHLSQFVVIGTPVKLSPIPRVVLDPDDDLGWAATPLPAVTELPFNIQLAQGVQGLLRAHCLADVVLTRDDPATPFVSFAMRAGIAAAANPDVTLTVAFDALTGRAWGGAGSGGSKFYSRGGGADDALTASLAGVVPAYTTRPGAIKIDPAYPSVEYGGLPGAVSHLETLYLDNNFDRPVIDDPLGFDSITVGVAKGVADYLETVGFNCTAPVVGGWPAPPSAAQIEAWRTLGFHNYSMFGGDPVSFSTGNLVEKEDLFSLPGVGSQTLSASVVYNSLDSRESRFGVGWSSGIGGRAQRFDDGSVMIVRGDGASNLFRSDGLGGYRAGPGVFETLSEGGGGLLVLRAVTGESWVFDAGDIDGIGELVSHKDRQGNSFTFAYGLPDPKVHRFVPLLSITDQAGQVVTVSNDASGHVTGFRLPDGQTWTLGYDAGFNLTSIQGPDGRTKSFTYDGSHRLTSIQDAAGVVFLKNTFDASGRVVSQLDAAGHLRSFSYDLAAGRTVYTDALGKKTVFSFDSRGRITARTNPAGNTASYTYNSDDLVTSFTDEAGAKFSYGYDAGGHPVTVTNPDGSTVSYTYTPTGEVVTKTDQGAPGGGARTTGFVVDPVSGLTSQVVAPDGGVTEYGFDARGNLTSQTTPGGAVTRYSYDARGNVGTATDATGGVTRYSYDAGNRVVREENPVGGVTLYSYDRAGRPVTVTDPAGGVNTFEYDVNDHLTKTTDATGGVTTYSWDDRFNLTQVVNPVGGVTRYEYNDEDVLTKTTDPVGGVTTYGLDDLYRAKTITDQAGAVWQKTLDAAGRVTGVTDPLGHTTSYTFDSMGRQTQTVSPLGVTSKTVFDRVGRPTEVIDGAGGVTRYSYDLLDRVIAVTDAEGNRASTQYTKDGAVARVTDRRGSETAFTYDAEGRQVSVTNALGATVTYGRDAAGRVTSVTDANGHTTTYSLDVLGRATQVTDALGQVTGLKYDPMGRTTEVVDPLNHSTKTTYTPLGQPATLTTPTGAVTTYQYDAAGQKISTTDANQHTTQYRYAPTGALARVVEGFDPGAPAPATGVADANITTTYTYTPTGNLHEVTNPNGETTTYTYTADSQLSTVTDPLGVAIHAYSYDAAGRVRQARDGNKNTTTYDYTPRSDVAKETSRDGVNEFEYDANQQLIAAQNAARVIGFEYDPIGQLTREIASSGDLVQHSYDAAGNQTSMTTPNGQVTRYEYDDINRLIAEKTPSGKVSYTHDAAGRITGVSRGGGVRSSLKYDEAGRVTGVVHQAPGSLPAGVPARTAPQPEGPCGCVSAGDYLTRRTLPDAGSALSGVDTISFGYAYDSVGNVSRETRTLSTPQTGGSIPVVDDRVYGYDKVNRLKETAETVTGGANQGTITTLFGYDPAANRVSVDEKTANPVGSVTGTSYTGATYNAANQVTQTVTEQMNVATGSRNTQKSAFAYDANGNQTVHTQTGSTASVPAVTSVTYDTANRPIREVGVAGSVQNVFDVLGREIEQVTTDDASGVTTARNTYAGNAVVQRVDAGGTTTINRDRAGGGTQSTTTPSGAVNTHRLLADRLGNVVAETGSTKTGEEALTQLASYSAWGKQTLNTTGWDTPLGYTGHTTNPVTGTVNFPARQYTPATATFSTPDTWPGEKTHPQTMNPYSYVINNPTTLIDPTGHRPWDPAVSVQGKRNGEWVYEPVTPPTTSYTEPSTGPDVHTPHRKTETITKRHPTFDRLSGLLNADTSSQQHWHNALQTISVDTAWIAEGLSIASAGLGIAAAFTLEAPPLAGPLALLSLALNRVGTGLSFISTATGCIDSNWDNACKVQILTNAFGLLFSVTPAGPIFSSLTGIPWLIYSGPPRWNW